MKILIVGGGVAGPALARFMKDNAEITLIDKAPKWGNIGYAITIWSNGLEILRKLGIHNEVLKEGYEIPWSVFEDKKGKILNSFFFKVFKPHDPTRVVTRTALQQVLVKDLEKSITIKLGTTISTVEQEESGATVTLTDGSTEKFDLVVGADGIRSQVREMVFGKNFLRYYGWRIYSFWVPQPLSSPRGALEFSSGGRMCFIYPMEDKAVIMFAVATKDIAIDKSENIKENLQKLFYDFKDSVGHMIDAIEDPEHVFRDNLGYIEMKDWYKGRVVLMGDAKHAISPITGMGSSMALEDAYVLSEELKANPTNISLALKNYERRRDGRIKRFHHISDSIEDVMMVKSPIVALFRDLLLKIVPASYFTGKIEKVLSEKL